MSKNRNNKPRNENERRDRKFKARSQHNIRRGERREIQRMDSTQFDS